MICLELMTPFAGNKM